MSLKGKKILLGVSGSIAAYKTPFLVRELIKQGCEIQVICTKHALDFVTEMSLSTVSKKPVHHDMFSDGEWNNHVKLGMWADLMLVAPATCHTIAKMSNGLCDSMLDAVYLSARCPVAIAPAMDADMYEHPSTQNNISTLASRKNHHILPVGEGELASGLVGKGRMMEVEDIVDWVQNFFNQKKKLSNKQVLITAGPTYEAIDPVRFIGNHSSGKMGIALAESAAREGAEVQLVLGPSSLSPDPAYSIAIHRVQSAQEMYDSSMAFAKSDIIICSAAVADFTPTEVSDEKIKKKDNDEMVISLRKNPDILKTLGQQKSKQQYLVGFALETNNELENAEKKREKKNADMIVLNSLNDKGAGFGGDTNKVTLLTESGAEALPLMSKEQVADIIIDRIYTATKDK